MNYQMTSKTARVITAKALTLVSVLLLAACDGGIFGTGGSDTIITDPTNGSDLSTDSTAQVDLESTNAVGTAGTGDSDDTGATDTGTDSESASQMTPESESGTADSDSDAGASATAGTGATAVDTGGDSPTSTTDGATDTGATDMVILRNSV